MPPTPIDSLGSIFSPNPRYLSNCSVGASVLPSPAGVQLFWVPRPSEGLFASVRQAEKQKSPPALSRPQPAICRAISELCLHLRETDNNRKSKMLQQWDNRVIYGNICLIDDRISGEVGRSWRYCNVRPTRDGVGASSWPPSPFKNQFNIEENTWFSYQILSW